MIREIVLRYFVKWPLIIGGTAFVTYSSHYHINRFICGVSFFHEQAEEGFVDKEQALRLDISYKRNRRGNLETFLDSYEDSLPIYERTNGVVVGSPEYNFSNLTKKERDSFCEGDFVYKKRKKRRKSRNLIHDLYKLFGD